MSAATTEKLASQLAEKIANKTAKVGIIGLGYVGLPLISAFTNAGFHCIGFDVDGEKVRQLKAGRSYIKHLASEKVADWIQREVLDPTNDMSRLSEADAYALGLSFGTLLSKQNGKHVMVGYDGRTTSPVLSKALIKGLTETGMNVENVGLGPTPMLYFSVKDRKADAGIMITGSHNPAE